MNSWNDPRVAISAALIALFAYAYIHNPTEAMTGALIAAFAAAYGYWIGASKGGSVAQEQTSAALAVAHEAARSIPTAPDAIREGDTITVKKEPEA